MPKIRRGYIEVDGAEYRVTDNLGWQNGYYVKEVATPAGPQMAVRETRACKWRFWTARDRLSGGPMSHYVGQSRSGNDVFRPKTDPAMAIYDAFQAEAEKRDSRTVQEWQESERNAVLLAATSEAVARGLQAPTLAEVIEAERSACGYVDYGAKWAYGVAERMVKP